MSCTHTMHVLIYICMNRYMYMYICTLYIPGNRSSQLVPVTCPVASYVDVSFVPLHMQSEQHA